MGFIQIQTLFFLGIPPRRTLKHDTVFPLLPFFRFTVVAGAKRGLSGSGGLCPFLWERPSADQVNNTVSVPLSFDVNQL
jgi:hypothetical protein